MPEQKRKILVTAGSTQAPIDQVRCISNVFKGRTGTEIALYLGQQGHNVTLLTSNPDLLDKDSRSKNLSQVFLYKTFWDLYDYMKNVVGMLGPEDAIIHSAAVSDYEVAEVMTVGPKGLVPINTTQKISSGNKELYLRLTQTPKIIDQIRDPWGFKGFLVKFKLQVGITDDELIQIAKESRRASKANIIVANCLEWAKESACAMNEEEEEHWVSRFDLPRFVHEEMIAFFQSRKESRR